MITTSLLFRVALVFFLLVIGLLFKDDATSNFWCNVFAPSVRLAINSFVKCLRHVAEIQFPVGLFHIKLARMLSNPMSSESFFKGNYPTLVRTTLTRTTKK